ncbi:MAG TPA: signal peptidase I [Candidatus Saccharimonadales bacterium]|nr:signal peptidase I [Candidatus Saccharimonadales bacterium]
MPNRPKKSDAEASESEDSSSSQSSSPLKTKLHKNKRAPWSADRRHHLRNIISTILIILLAPAIAIILTLYVFQQYQVDGPSMQPTLHNGNRLIVLKLARTWSRITGHPYIPKRGDIIIFQENNLYNLADEGTNQLVKRVIGLPGDHLVIKNGVVTIYNKAHPKGFDPDKTLPYGTVIGYTSGNINIVIPKDQVFVCGDNRGDSLDSRVFGTVPVKNIIGQLVAKITPVSQSKTF